MRELLITIYTSLFLLAPMFSNKILIIGGFKVMAGIVLMTLACGILDVINNNYGPNYARKTVTISAVTRAIVWCIGLVVVSMQGIVIVEGFDKFVVSTFRILIAGEVAIVLSQYFIDIKVFDVVSRRFESFFLKYNISTVISQIASISIFIMIALYGKVENITPILLSGILFRVTATICMTPVMQLMNYFTQRYGD